MMLRVGLPRLMFGLVARFFLRRLARRMSRSGRRPGWMSLGRGRGRGGGMRWRSWRGRSGRMRWWGWCMNFSGMWRGRRGGGGMRRRPWRMHLSGMWRGRRGGGGWTRWRPRRMNLGRMCFCRMRRRSCGCASAGPRQRPLRMLGSAGMVKFGRVPWLGRRPRRLRGRGGMRRLAGARRRSSAAWSGGGGGAGTRRSSAGRGRAGARSRGRGAWRMVCPLPGPGCATTVEATVPLGCGPATAAGCGRCASGTAATGAVRRQVSFWMTIWLLVLLVALVIW